jgi:hypothetical protein
MASIGEDPTRFLSQGDLQNSTKPRDYPAELRVASISDSERNSDDKCWLREDDKEGWGEIETKETH